MATADEYATWIVQNQARKGTPEFETVAKAYQEAKGDGQQNFGPAPESPAMQSGRQMNSSVQGLINAAQGPTFGFADEIGGALGAIGHKILPFGNDQPFAENYRNIRDEYRGATKQFEEDRPLTSIGTRLAAAAPTMMLGAGGGVPAAGMQAMGPLARIGQAARIGGVQGATSGAGESTADNALGVAGDAAKGGALAAAMGGGITGVGSAMGGVGSNIMQRLSESSAADKARLMMAELLRKDARGIGASNPAAQVEARMGRLGSEATIADAAGANTRQMVDTLATLPGDAKGATERLIHDRQAGRAARIMDSAEQGLAPGKQGYVATLDALDTAKKTAAAPLYDALKGVSVRVDADLASTLQAAEKAHGGAELLAKLRKELPIDLSKIKAGDDVPFAALDKVKQSLYDLGQSAKQAGNRTLGVAYDDLRIGLTKKMDSLSPQDAGGSIYKQARNAYAGPAQLSDAVTAGRGAMKADAIGVGELTKDLTASELEAFKIGALQAIRDKVGTEAGQTSLLKMWKEPATSDKLREIFGGDYRAFSAEVAKEARLKLLESAGRGSQTAARLFGAGEMDAMGAVGAAGQAAVGAAHGNPVPAISGAARIWNQVKTPETTRNELAKLLLQGGSGARNELQSLPSFIAQTNANRMRAAALAGAISGQSRDRR